MSGGVTCPIVLNVMLSPEGADITQIDAGGIHYGLYDTGVLESRDCDGVRLLHTVTELAILVGGQQLKVEGKANVAGFVVKFL